MKVGFLITNGGSHPPDKWAELTTETILDLLVDANPDDNSPQAAAARKSKRDLRGVLFEALNRHHEGVQAQERDALTTAIKTVKKAQAYAADHTLLDPNPFKATVMGDVKAILAKTQWAAHFAKTEVENVLWQIIGQHTVDVMHIERKWHRDRLSAAQGA